MFSLICSLFLNCNCSPSLASLCILCPFRSCIWVPRRMFVSIRVLHFSLLFFLLQQCSIGLYPFLNRWSPWNIFLLQQCSIGLHPSINRWSPWNIFLLQQCFIGLHPSINRWSPWNIFLCISKYSSVSNSYVTFFFLKRNSHFEEVRYFLKFVGTPSLNVNMLLYIFPFSSTYTGFPDMLVS